MELLLLTACLLFSCLNDFTEGNTHSQQFPRMVFTDKEATVIRLPLQGDPAPVPILLEEQMDTVIVAGHTNLNSYNFQNSRKTPVKRTVLWSECLNNGLNYNVTIVNKRKEAGQVFVCGTDGKETACCETTLSDQTPMPHLSQKMSDIKRSIREFIIKEGESSALVESAERADLYVTYSGSQDYVGIHKFGKDKVGPANHDKEQHYVGLIPITHTNNSTQDKVYAFYKERNRDTGMYSNMWLPYVTRVCMSDVGGPKNNLQFSWTSQMNAKLFCGDPDSKRHFSELVDVATVRAERWQDTRIYALFRNEWGMGAVCVYTIQDIDNIFATSPFEDDSTGNKNSRSRMCVDDSKKIPLDTLKMIEKTSEMKQWVQPANNSGPLLFKHHNYTHIYVDSSQLLKNYGHVVLFLSLNNGRIHKVTHSRTHVLVITEYQPFNHGTDIFSIVLHPSSRKLYVKSRSELVQLDVANCDQYGDSCEDCVLARDPYCGWKGTQCIPVTQDSLQDVSGGNHTICSHPPKKEFRYSHSTHADKGVNTITIPAQSKYFLRCPVSSHHAQYTWSHLKSSMSCSSKEPDCLFLIDSMGPQQVGTYKCVSEEMGYRKVLAEYSLQLESRAMRQMSSPLIWVCLMVVLTKSLSC